MVIWIWTFPFLENWQFNHKLGLPLFYKHTVPDPAGIYLLKVNNGKTRTKVWNAFKVNNEDTKMTSGVVLVSLLLALNIFHTFFLVFLEHVLTGWVKDYPPNSTKYEFNATSKIPISKLFSELRIIWKCS